MDGVGAFDGLDDEPNNFIFSFLLRSCADWFFSENHEERFAGSSHRQKLKVLLENTSLPGKRLHAELRKPVLNLHGKFSPPRLLADLIIGEIVSKLSILKELWSFLRVRKKWWLTPIIVVLVLLGFLIVFSQGSALAPFIYTLF